MRRANPVFHFAEALWYLAGRRDLEMIGYYAPSMRSSSADGVNLGGSAYGYTLFNPASGDTVSPFDRVLELLRTETDSKGVTYRSSQPLSWPSATTPIWRA